MVSNPSSFPSETFGWAVNYVRFASESRDSQGSRKTSANGPKRTFN